MEAQSWSHVSPLPNIMQCALSPLPFPLHSYDRTCHAVRPSELRAWRAVEGLQLGGVRSSRYDRGVYLGEAKKGRGQLGVSWGGS